jgi:hypothetical protein
MAEAAPVDELVPDDVIPHRHLPPLKYRDLPEPVPWLTMVGPSLILAGLALGSGEFILWPRIVYTSGFVFIWAAFLGIVTQFFLNLEIERWTLATGESTVTGFCRLSWHWSWVFLILNIVPWAFPGWSTGAAHIGSWLLLGPREVATASGAISYEAWYVTPLSIAGLVLTGVVLTAGPVVYNTVETLQSWLVGTIVLLVAVIAVVTVRWDAVVALTVGLFQFGRMPDPATSGLGMLDLLGAVAFAGAGGTMNLGQSHYVKDKGYGMGRYIGRITSPLTGKEETISSTGYYFRQTPENMARWQGWWRAANIEHAFSFLLTCLVTLFLLALIAYSLFYDANGQLNPAAQNLGKGMNFVWAQAELLRQRPLGELLRFCYLLAGVAILLTTELGVLDVVSRLTADLIKVNYLPENDRWSTGRLYFLCLWTEIAVGSVILLCFTQEPVLLFRIAAAMNGAVMFLYSMILLYMNNMILPRGLSSSPLRFLALVWACAFFGYFTLQSVQLSLLPMLLGS